MSYVFRHHLAVWNEYFRSQMGVIIGLIREWWGRLSLIANAVESNLLRNPVKFDLSIWHWKLLGILVFYMYVFPKLLIKNWWDYILERAWNMVFSKRDYILVIFDLALLPSELHIFFRCPDHRGHSRRCCSVTTYLLWQKKTFGNQQHCVVKPKNIQCPHMKNKRTRKAQTSIRSKEADDF